MADKSVFAVVVGSGFAGSILSWILQRHGRQTLILDRASHPRFAIGESSTPTADFLLAFLSHRWSLPELMPLAAYGTWQQSYPDLRCGLKRGFSYYGHDAGQPYEDDAFNSKSLLVGASATDFWSDTHWYRADVDAFLARQSQAAGVEVHERTVIESAEWNPAQQQWQIVLRSKIEESEKVHSLRASWLIDASGSGNATAKWCGHNPDDDWMRTRSSAIFGHFDQVSSFSRAQSCYEKEVSYCFDSDNAAQHHVLENGWLWTLRFGGNRTSVGFVQPESQMLDSSEAIERDWQRTIAKYPSVASMMKRSTLVEPSDCDGVPKLGYVSRMSRCRTKPVGAGWIMLPVAYGFVDPLHSTGIAHALSGVVRIADCLLGNVVEQQKKLGSYSQALRTELEWIDTLVSGSYEGLPSFEKFIHYASFYFAATIAFENQLANDPEHWPMGFLNAEDIRLRDIAENQWRMARNITSAQSRVRIREAIEPWNSVGLLSSEKRNRFTHSAPPKRALWVPIDKGLESII